MRSSRTTALVLVTLATFTAFLAYSIAVPVLPDLSRRFGASPTTIGLLFASFGITVLATSVPMGAVSDRLGRRVPLVAGCLGLAVSTIVFAYADSLTLLFVARLAQGAADAVTWVVGFALIADVYGPGERGRAMGAVMSATTFGFMIGPTFGGWLYERGGAKVPYLLVAGLSIVVASGFLWWRSPARQAQSDRVPIHQVLRIPAVAFCAAAVVAGGGTLVMLEPVLALYLSEAIGLGPSGIGLVFGSGAVVSAVLHPLAGRISDRVGGRVMLLAGLTGMALLLPALAGIRSLATGIVLHAVFTVAAVTVVTPSLASMAAAAWVAGVRSYGVAYGVYNFAWALGLLIGPPLGAAVYEHAGFTVLVFGWGTGLLVCTALLARAGDPAKVQQAV
ncbi:MAG: MFS transporter [Vicinamibacterales bacterium]